MIHALTLPEPAHARVQRRNLRCPLARIGADLDDLAVAHVRVDHASAATVVTAGAGDDGFSGLGGNARRFVEDARRGHGPVSIARPGRKSSGMAGFSPR